MSHQTTNPAGVNANSAGLEFVGGTLVVSQAAMDVTLGTGAGEANFLTDDDIAPGRIPGGGYAAAGNDVTLTFNGGDVLKYNSTPSWLSGSSRLGLNNSALATHSIELTNDLDFNSVSGNNNTRAFQVADGQTAVLSGDILDTGANRNDPDVFDHAVFAVPPTSKQQLKSRQRVRQNPNAGHFIDFALGALHTQRST